MIIRREKQAKQELVVAAAATHRILIGTGKMINKYYFWILLLFLWNNQLNALKFTIEPVDTVVPEGNSVLLPCSGTSATKRDGKIPVTNIRWRGPDGQDIGIVGDTFRTQTANGSLYISSVEENRGLTGSYQCVLSVDGIGTIVSRSARVSIAKLPETNSLFSEIDLHTGQTAYLKCLNGPIQSNIKFNIDWLKDDRILQLDKTRMLIFPSGSLEIDAVKKEDEGVYLCNVTYGATSRLSSKTSLNMRDGGDPKSEPPTFLTESHSQTVREGDTITLDCVSNGFPKPMIKWLRNGQDIDISDFDSRFRIIGTGSLQIESVQDSDAGNYQCRSSNSEDSVDMQVTIQVQVPPKFVQVPVDKVGMKKEELEFVCEIRGKPTPVIQWMKNGDVITPNEYMQIVGGHNLKIAGLISSDAGMFQCIGSNPAGSVQASARLKISESGRSKGTYKQSVQTKLNADRIVKQIQIKDQSKHTKNLSKSVLDSLLTKDGTRQSQSDHKRTAFDNLKDSDNYGYNSDRIDDDFDDDDTDDDDYGTIYPYGPGIDPRKLLTKLTADKNHPKDHISHFSQPPLPTYTRNYPGLDDGKEVKAPVPGPPRDLVAQIVNPRFVALSWMEPLKNPDEVTSYSVYYKMTTSERERKLTTKSRDDQLANIQSLLPGKTYQFRVVGNSNHGPGESSEIIEVETEPEENIASPPRNVQAHPINHKEIYVKWEEPLVPNGNISKYRIYYSEDAEAEMYTDSTSLEAILSELRPYTEYTISVRPFNQNGMGDTSTELYVKTFSSVPSESPINVTLEATSSTSITVRWEPPPEKEQNGQITGYKIRYRKKKQLQVETTPANVRHFELKGLDKMAEYQVKIAAITVNGTGPFSEWNHIETLENDLTETHVPGSPLWLKARPGADSISVTWGPPANSEVKVRGYVLGWGIGYPDVDSFALDENVRFYEIVNLKSNSEYVISLRARNKMGYGEPKYDYVRTRDDPIDSHGALAVPVGLRAVPMSPTSIVVYWTDTTLNRNQQSIDNRRYVVRYNSADTNRYKQFNTTDMNCMITDLRSNTQYEFAVKMVKGNRESPWSMSVFNSTSQPAQIGPPRDVSVLPDEHNPSNVIVEWTAPRQSNGLINGYIVFYTMDTTKRDRDWQVEAVVGDQHTATIRNLKPHSTYYFKVQTRAIKGQNGAFSTLASYTTGNAITLPEQSVATGISNEMIFIVAGVAVVLLAILAFSLAILCRRKPPMTPEHIKQSYQKNNVGIKPPDLWIHHDQMELKNVEKNHTNPTGGCSDAASSSGAMTLPRSVGHEYDHDSNGLQVTNSLDKRGYAPGYMTTSMNSTMDRQGYPRLPYNNNKSHIPMDPSVHLSQQNLSQSQNSSLVQTPDNQYGYDSMPNNYSNPSVTYAPGLSVDAPKRGHPLKSFSQPGPPSAVPLISNQTKQNVPAVTIRPQQNVSPYKKTSLSNALPNRLQSGPSVAHSNDEIQRLAPSTSTEELNQEMANLEGLMKDLSAITANEFEC